ncbi:hypothetical protein QN359_01000 [Undibacterium sp. 5I2]|nr:hypothetical protein [Undibacterium sp. 5I2]
MIASIVLVCMALNMVVVLSLHYMVMRAATIRHHRCRQALQGQG